MLTAEQGIKALIGRGSRCSQDLRLELLVADLFLDDLVHLVAVLLLLLAAFLLGRVLALLALLLAN